MKKELPAVQKAYDLCRELLTRVSNFPKDYKFSLGDSLVGWVLTHHDLPAVSKPSNSALALQDELSG